MLQSRLQICMKEEGVHTKGACEAREDVWHAVAANLGHVMGDIEDGNELLLKKQEAEYQGAMVLGELRRQMAKVENSSVRRVRVDALCDIVDTLNAFVLGEGASLYRDYEDEDINRGVSGECFPLGASVLAVKRHDLWYVLGKKLTFLVQRCLEDRKQYWSEFSSDEARNCTMTRDMIRKSHQAVDDELWYMMVLYRQSLSLFPELVEEAMQVKIHKDVLENLMDAGCIGMLVQHELEERTAVSCIEALVGLQENAHCILVELIENERFVEQILDTILGNSLVPESVRIAAAKAVIVMMQDDEKCKLIDKCPEQPSSSETIIHDEQYSKVEIARSEAKEYIITRLGREGGMLATSSSIANSKNDPNHVERRASALAMLLLHTNDT